MKFLDIGEDMGELLEVRRAARDEFTVKVRYKLAFELEPLDQRRNPIKCSERTIMNINQIGVPIQPEVLVGLGVTAPERVRGNPLIQAQISGFLAGVQRGWHRRRRDNACVVVFGIWVERGSICEANGHGPWFDRHFPDDATDVPWEAGEWVESIRGHGASPFLCTCND